MRNFIHKNGLTLCLAASLASAFVPESFAQRPSTRKCGGAPADLFARDSFVPQKAQEAARFRAYVLHRANQETPLAGRLIQWAVDRGACIPISWMTQ